MDWIDELVQASLDGPRRGGPIEDCKHCNSSFHGLPTSSCPGFSLNVEAIQNQGVIDWTAFNAE